MNDCMSYITHFNCASNLFSQICLCDDNVAIICLSTVCKYPISFGSRNIQEGEAVVLLGNRYAKNFPWKHIGGKRTQMSFPWRLVGRQVDLEHVSRCRQSYVVSWPLMNSPDCHVCLILQTRCHMSHHFRCYHVPSRSWNGLLLAIWKSLTVKYEEGSFINFSWPHWQWWESESARDDPANSRPMSDRDHWSSISLLKLPILLPLLCDSKATPPLVSKRLEWLYRCKLDNYYFMSSLPGTHCITLWSSTIVSLRFFTDARVLFPWTTVHPSSAFGTSIDSFLSSFSNTRSYSISPSYNPSSGKFLPNKATTALGFKNYYQEIVTHSLQALSGGFLLVPGTM